jgi:RHS repeat-associated protein
LIKDVAFDLRFPGQFVDTESGLHYNYFRDYDPKTGRYVESDPTGLDGGINTYIYVLNNPDRYIDQKAEAAVAAGALCFIPGVGWVSCAVAATITVASACIYYGSKALIQFTLGDSDASACGPRQLCSVSKKSQKERSTDVPSYAKNYEKDPNESCHEYAISILIQQFGQNHPKVNKRSPGSDYSKIKKNCERG